MLLAQARGAGCVTRRGLLTIRSPSVGRDRPDRPITITEPFFLVGIFARVKEFLFVAGTQRSREEGWPKFTEAMAEGWSVGGVGRDLAAGGLQVAAASS